VVAPQCGKEQRGVDWSVEDMDCLPPVCDIRGDRGKISANEGESTAAMAFELVGRCKAAPAGCCWLSCHRGDVTTCADTAGVLCGHVVLSPAGQHLLPHLCAAWCAGPTLLQEDRGNKGGMMHLVLL